MAGKCLDEASKCLDEVIIVVCHPSPVHRSSLSIVISRFSGMKFSVSLQFVFEFSLRGLGSVVLIGVAWSSGATCSV